jgi:hypothetical protein
MKMVLKFLLNYQGLISPGQDLYWVVSGGRNISSIPYLIEGISAFIKKLTFLQLITASRI